MKREKLRALIEEILDYRDSRVSEETVTVDTLGIDFEARVVTFRGRTIRPDAPGVDFPVLSTTHIVVPQSGSGRDVL